MRGGDEQNRGAGAGGGGTGGQATESAPTYVARATGGGGGGSYVHPTYRVGTATLGYSSRTILERCSLTVYFNS